MLELIDLKAEKSNVFSEVEIMEVLQQLSQETACSLHYLTQHSLCIALHQTVQEPNYPDCSKNFGLSYQGAQVCIS